MKLFAINETEWIAANSKEEAIDLSGLEPEEINECEEIPESEWDEEIVGFDEGKNHEFKISIRALMAIAIKRNEPMYVMTENE